MKNLPPMSTISSNIQYRNSLIKHSPRKLRVTQIEWSVYVRVAIEKGNLKSKNIQNSFCLRRLIAYDKITWNRVGWQMLEREKRYYNGNNGFAVNVVCVNLTISFLCNGSSINRRYILTQSSFPIHIFSS